MDNSKIFDAHCHYDDGWFDEDRQQIFQELPKQGVAYIVNNAVDLKTAEIAKNYSEKYPYIYFTAGFHPENLEDMPADYLDRLKEYLSHPKCVAMGEIGLDYHWDVPKDLQLRVFKEQLELAKVLDVPVIIHDREAHGDVMDILRQYKPKGLMHCFSGSVEMMREVMKIGMYISLGGTVTFKNARHSVDCAREVPLDRLLLETDAPYLSPVPLRGKRNDSRNIKYVAEKIAEIRGMTGEDILKITTENAKKFYGIK